MRNPIRLNPLLIMILMAAIIFACIAYFLGMISGYQITKAEESSKLIDIYSAFGGWLSAIGTFFAAMAALFIANRQEKLAILDRKQEIYDAFYHLKMHMLQKRGFAELSYVSKFFYHSRNSKIYFPEISSDIENFFDACFWIASNNQDTPQMENEDQESTQSKLQSVDKLGPRIESKILTDLKV